MAKEIELTKGAFAIIDDEDYEWISQYKWHYQADKTVGYAVTQIAGTVTLMHRLIVPVKKGDQVDHINGDGLDNRRKNLRAATHAQNCYNRRVTSNSTSFYKGVRLDSRFQSTWKASIAVNGRTLQLGKFLSEIEAAKKYNEAAQKYFGEFARPNVLDGTHQDRVFSERSEQEGRLSREGVIIPSKTSRFRGVGFHKSSNRWRAIIYLTGRGIYVGKFHNEVDAAIAYDKAAIEMFGSNAILNFP